MHNFYLKWTPVILATDKNHINFRHESIFWNCKGHKVSWLIRTPQLNKKPIHVLRHDTQPDKAL